MYNSTSFYCPRPRRCPTCGQPTTCPCCGRRDAEPYTYPRIPYTQPWYVNPWHTTVQIDATNTYDPTRGYASIQ